MGVGVSLLGMVPDDHSVKNYISTEKMKVKLLPLDKSHVQRVVKDKSQIPRDTRNRMLRGGGHITRRSSVSCWSYLTSVKSGYNVFSRVLSRFASMHYNGSTQEVDLLMMRHFSPIQWNLYQADTLGESCSFRLIQGVRLIQVSIDNDMWDVKCHSNEQWERLEYSQRLWRYTFAWISLTKWTNWS